MEEGEGERGREEGGGVIREEWRRERKGEGERRGRGNEGLLRLLRYKAVSR